MKQLWRSILFVSITGISLSTLTASGVASEARRARRNSDGQLFLSSQNSRDEREEEQEELTRQTQLVEQLEQQHREALTQQAQTVEQLVEQLDQLSQQGYDVEPELPYMEEVTKSLQHSEGSFDQNFNARVSLLAGRIERMQQNCRMRKWAVGITGSAALGLVCAAVYFLCTEQSEEIRNV